MSILCWGVLERRAAAAAKSLQSCPTLCDPIRQQPTRLPHPWDSLGKNTGVGCHFLLQCMKVKSESKVAQSCQTLCDPMDHSLPASSIHGILQARVRSGLPLLSPERRAQPHKKGFRSSNSAFSQMGPTWAPYFQSLLSLIYILHLCTGPWEFQKVPDEDEKLALNQEPNLHKHFRYTA